MQDAPETMICGMLLCTFGPMWRLPGNDRVLHAGSQAGTVALPFFRKQRLEVAALG